MVETTDILALGREAVVLALTLSSPLLCAALLSGLVTAVLQSITRLSDTALSIVPKIIAVSLVLILAGPWMGGRLAGFATRIWSLLQAVDL